MTYTGEFGGTKLTDRPKRHLPITERPTHHAVRRARPLCMTQRRWLRIETVRDDCSPSFRNELQQGVWRRFSPAVQQPVEASGPVIPVRQRGYLPEHIPQQLPREWIEILLDNGAPLGLGGVLSRFRRIAAIQLVQAADGISATGASRLLGFPSSRPRPGHLGLTPKPENPWTRMHVNERLPEAFEALARHIAGQSHPVDYHERRQLSGALRSRKARKARGPDRSVPLVAVVVPILRGVDRTGVLSRTSCLSAVSRSFGGGA
ncbi:hypothetical protein [Kitasatospora sp. NPDC050463]|uniref:hypothetical protein n=1 Tax=Kitasatospora sp. NPDC050463 TaxID=3155786 RepID=UPI00340FA069